MNIKKLREATKMSQKAFGEALGLSPQSILNYEAGKNVPETVKKLIRYEFAEFLPEEERLSTVSNGKTTVENESVKELRQQNEELKGAAQELVYAKKEIELLKRNIELLEDQVRMYKTMVPGENKSKTA